MTETKKGIGRAGIGLLVLVVLAGALTVSNLWVYVSLQEQIDSLETDNSNLNVQVNSLQTDNDSLEDQVSDLQTDKSNLQSQVHTLQSENGDLQSEVDFLQSEVADLEWEISDLEWEISYLQQTAEGNKFEFYYASLARQRFGVDDLDEYLDRWKWVEGSYVKGVFDCSEMSAYIEWRLENEGYHTYIACGESPWGGGYHAWLLVETSEGAYMPVEATEYDVVWWSDLYFDNYFEYDYLFETIHDALDYSHDEFDWWN